MNQIGHLPENSATQGESALFANTVMYISQRKQCEICAANQNSQEDSHFVIRVSSVNYMQVLSALQAGGSFWYPLNGCYQVVDDLTLPEGWEPIKNFSGHWNSDAYHVNLASNGKPLFDNTGNTYGMFTTGSNNGWNLGNDKTVGALPVLKLDNQPNVRITGVARVVGDLNALFPDDGVSDYTGYRVIVHATDGTDYDCVVNGDSKYVISNVPCTGMQRAEVIDPSGHSVVEYGMIVVDVPNHFWNDCETHPLELLKPTADPIDDYKDWEGPVNKTVGSKLFYDQTVPDSNVKWYYRAITESGKMSQWFEIGGPGTSFTTYDGVVKGKINKTTFTAAATNADIPYTESTVTYTTLDYCNEKIQFKCEFTVAGKQYTSLDKAEDGKNGYCESALRPMYIEQAFDKRIPVGETTTFDFDLNYWKGVNEGVTYTVQYRDENNTWVEVGSDPDLFPADSFTVTTKVIVHDFRGRHIESHRLILTDRQLNVSVQNDLRDIYLILLRGAKTRREDKRRHSDKRQNDDDGIFQNAVLPCLVLDIFRSHIIYYPFCCSMSFSSLCGANGILKFTFDMMLFLGTKCSSQYLES